MNNRSSARSFWSFFWPLLLGLVVIGGVWLSFQSIEVRVTQQQAQAMLDAQLAKMRAENKAYKIEKAQIQFGNDEMTIVVAGSYSAKVKNFPEQELTTELNAVGDPDYRSGSIYFNASEFTLKSFLINRESPSDVVKKLIAEAATTLVPDARTSVLNNDKVKNALEKFGVSVDEAQSDVAISGAALAADALVNEYKAEGKKLLEASVLTLLETTPLYTLGKDWKEQLAMAALSDIGIKNGVFTATLTGAQLLWTLLTVVIALVIVVAWIVSRMRGAGAELAVDIVLDTLDI